MKIIVTGSSGMIGHHLGRYLKSLGHSVVGIDIVEPKYQDSIDEFYQVDLRKPYEYPTAFSGVDRVYALAAMNGSIEYTSKADAEIVHDNTLININTAQACVTAHVKRLFFSSSACIYPENLQGHNPTYLSEDMAYPANPDSEYGWEKLFSERMYQSYQKDLGLEVRIARFFNIYGPEGHLDEKRMKAPTAICKKVYHSTRAPIPVWGENGKAIRSFCYIDDCVKAVEMVMNSDSSDPFNIGTIEHMSVDDLVRTVAGVASKDIRVEYEGHKAQGVLNRLCDFSRIEKELGWKPEVNFEEGIRRTYEWIKSVS